MSRHGALWTVVNRVLALAFTVKTSTCGNERRKPAEGEEDQIFSHEYEFEKDRK